MTIEKGPGAGDAEASKSCSLDQQNIETIAQSTSWLKVNWSAEASYPHLLIQQGA